MLSFFFRAGWLVLGCALLFAACDSENSDRTEPPEAPPSDPGAVASHPARIVADGDTDDWAALRPLADDPAGDAPAEGVDFRRVWMAHDAQFVFLRFELERERSLQEGNDLTLFIDTDNDAATGRAAQGLGAEVVWTFGERSGRYVSANGSREIGHPALGMVTAPTVTSSTFEVAFRREAEPTGRPLFPGDTLRIALADQQTNGDALPDAENGLTYRLTSAEDVSAPEPADLERADGTALRVMSYNVEFDGLFEANKAPRFRRIFAATRPDVIGFQEIYDHDAAVTQERMTELAPLAEGGTWHTAKAGRDLIAASRYPIEQTYTIDGYQNYRSAGFVIDAQDALGSSVLLIVTHPPCCSGGTPPADVRRQQVVDGIVAFLRDAQTEGGTLDLPANTPIIITGDMNFVGDHQQPLTLRTGEIINTDRYGAPIDPDWDGSPLTDAAPPVTGWPMNFTWYDLGSSFGPGRLDYIYYTDSVLDGLKSYVLFTPGMTPDRRSEAGLQEQDTPEAADHLPVVVDFAGRE